MGNEHDLEKMLLEIMQQIAELYNLPWNPNTKLLDGVKTFEDLVATDIKIDPRELQRSIHAHFSW